MWAAVDLEVLYSLTRLRYLLLQFGEDFDLLRKSEGSLKKHSPVNHDPKRFSVFSTSDTQGAP